MDIKKARLYAWLSFGAAFFMLCLTFLFALTLFYQSYRDNEGHGLNVIPQFLSSPVKGTNVAITIPLGNGSDSYDRSSEHRLMEEMLVRYYLENRYSYFPDKAEMLHRWGSSGPLARISTPDMHKKFMGNNLENKIQKMPKENRTVNVVSVERISDVNRYDVEMQVLTIDENGQFNSQTYKVALHFKYSNAYKSLYNEPINPYGLYFTLIEKAKNLNN